MTCPPAASILAAAAITSITMNGGTSLRAYGVSRVFTRSLSVASCIDFCYLGGYRRYRVPEPVTAPDWPHSKACYFMACYSVFRRSDTGPRQESEPNRIRPIRTRPLTDRHLIKDRPCCFVSPSPRKR